MVGLGWLVCTAACARPQRPLHCILPAQHRGVVREPCVWCVAVVCCVCQELSIRGCVAAGGWCANRWSAALKCIDPRGLWCAVDVGVQLLCVLMSVCVMTAGVCM
eukprot:GHRQ01003375.1.p2 GENE.GHRQ01003375.1~~GHRQ01003375.1.p2  ORF type:complete len:105 (+),score=11.09 GHRQ01003375.1:349-663(+)